MTRVLLVTGSRSLATIPGADAWGRALIRHALDGVDLLIVGDADGPDMWAWAGAIDRGVHTRAYRTRGANAGWVWRTGFGHVERWSLDASRASTHPLARNAAMVRDAASLAAQGADVRCLALIDPRSRTKGTEHTAGLAERAGITVQREVGG